MKRLAAALVLALRALALAADSGPARFDEVWAYLMDGEERFAQAARGVTDFGYFGAGIGNSGKLVGLPERGKLAPFKGRVHLVVAELGNYALEHFCLDPGFPLRDALVADIAAASAAYDGVQIDFEALGPKDYENFYAFLALLKAALGPKTLSVALSAQIKEVRDNLSYERIGKIADRIVVMAYDEHWSASVPGPVASIDWCRRVAAYALSKIEGSRLVMGAPFYGRAWADKSPSRAYKYSSLVKLIEERGLGPIKREGDIPFVEYVEVVAVKLYFDDLASIQSRLAMYRSSGVRSVAFWRLGQEDPGVWDEIAGAPGQGLPEAALPGPAASAPPASTGAPAPAAVPLADTSAPPYRLP